MMRVVEAMKDVHPDIALALNFLCQAGYVCSVPLPETQNADYGAAVAVIGDIRVRLRVGRQTPTKPGVFVVAWRRSSTGGTEPFPSSDDVETLIAVAREGDRYGMFVFPLAALVVHGIVSVNGIGGKRGFRLYPPWSPTVNPTATKTQSWQCAYFLELTPPITADDARMGALLALGTAEG